MHTDYETILERPMELDETKQKLELMRFAFAAVVRQNTQLLRENEMLRCMNNEWAIRDQTRGPFV